MDGAIHELFTGHLRSIIGNLTVEDLILNRERLTSQTRTSSADEMSKLGLVVDSLQIQEIDDETGYITTSASRTPPPVAAAARIAEAQRNQEATEAEQIAGGRTPGQIRDTEIKQAEYQGQVDQAAAAGDARRSSSRRPGTPSWRPSAARSAWRPRSASPPTPRRTRR